MTRRYDLHTHSRLSDGILAPAELVAHARTRQVDVLALTDHDVTDGLAEAAAAAAACGLTFVPGVEISVTWGNQTVHIIGLRVDATAPDLQHGLARLRATRLERAREIDRRLQKKRITGALEGAQALCHGATLSRTHFARFLIQTGHAPDLRRAFRQFLSHGAPAYVPVQWAGLEQAVGWIGGAGGQAALAHPARYKLSPGKLRSLIGEFKDCGGAALEVISGTHSAEENRRFAALALRFDLRASVGSDYHGPEKPWVEVGRLPPLPAGCVPVWQDWKE